MDIFPEVVARDFIVLRSKEARAPEELTDGQLLSQLHDAEKERTIGNGESAPEADLRLERLLQEARRRFLISSK